MKHYPSIKGPRDAPLGERCIAFRKYDGSNLRWEWSLKRGWYKFGTRRRLFDETDPDYGCAVAIFMEKLALALESVFRTSYKSVERVIVYTEFFGPSSFAGKHVSDEPKELRLIDVNLHKKGLISPREFVNEFGYLSFAAEVIREGVLDDEFIEQVRTGHYDVDEGVVCKGGVGHRLWMCKIKTDQYRERLKSAFAEGWEQFWE